MKRSLVFQRRKQAELLLAEGSRRTFPSRCCQVFRSGPKRAGTSSRLSPPPPRGILRWETTASSGFRGICVLSLATAALQSTRSGARCLTAAPARRAAPAEQGVERRGGFRHPRDLSAHGFRAASLLEQHGCSGLLFYCERSSCPVPFASLKRCWGALPAGLLCRGREMRLWREDAPANVPLSAPVPCALAFFPWFSLLHLPKSIPEFVPLSFHSGRCRSCCRKTWFSPTWKTDLDPGADRPNIGAFTS